MAYCRDVYVNIDVTMTTGFDSYLFLEFVVSLSGRFYFYFYFLNN